MTVLCEQRNIPELNHFNAARGSKERLFCAEKQKGHWVVDAREKIERAVKVYFVEWEAERPYRDSEGWLTDFLRGARTRLLGHFVIRATT